MKRIDSRVNPFYRSCKAILSAKGIKEENHILLSGRKLVPEFLKKPGFRPVALIISDPKEIELLAFPKTLDVIWMAKDLFDEIDEAGTHFPLLVLEAPPIRTTNLSYEPKGLEVVLALSNPLNIGAALRACEAFDASKITLLKECAHPYLPKVVRASSGSSLIVPLQYGPSIQDLENTQARVMTALSSQGEPMTHHKWPKDCRIIIGEEGRGLPKTLDFGRRVSIPIKKSMDSLNAAAAMSISLYSYRQIHPMEPNSGHPKR